MGGGRARGGGRKEGWVRRDMEAREDGLSAGPREAPGAPGRKLIVCEWRRQQQGRAESACIGDNGAR